MRARVAALMLIAVLSGAPCMTSSATAGSITTTCVEFVQAAPSVLRSISAETSIRGFQAQTTTGSTTSTSPRAYRGMVRLGILALAGVAYAIKRIFGGSGD